MRHLRVPKRKTLDVGGLGRSPKPANSTRVARLLAYDFARFLGFKNEDKTALAKDWNGPVEKAA